MLTTDELARLRAAFDECVTGTFVHRDELAELLRVYEAVLAAPETRVRESVVRSDTPGVVVAHVGPEFLGQTVRLVPLATAKGESNG